MPFKALEEFVENLQYSKMVKLKKCMDLLRLSIGEDQIKRGLRRMEWTELGIVGSFSSMNVYEKHNEELMEYFDNHGVIGQVMNIKWRELLSHEQLLISGLCKPKEPYIRFTPKRTKNESAYDFDGYQLKLANQSIQSQIIEWKSNKWLYNRLFDSWVIIRKRALQGLLEQEKRKEFLPVGSVSLIQSDPEISSLHVQKYLGNEPLISRGRVDMSKVKEYAARGFFSLLEIQQLQKISDVRSTYRLMEISSERQALIVQHWREMHYSFLSRPPQNHFFRNEM
ncbi:hypothetical protein [Paenibacillus xylanilyticus]|uniref:Uncharacterized protein n=1 Tax=Paenibacillus xylanilyticus TaxID=248903 RepID=A0A7Y6BSQ9_9BACL|nr:hypothetical protein [Paenibacillus xylanilyticus]NUU74323.1 hypothetical protein [Paenibacillus xylanilyticus]